MPQKYNRVFSGVTAMESWIQARGMSKRILCKNGSPLVIVRRPMKHWIAQAYQIKLKNHSMGSLLKISWLYRFSQPHSFFLCPWLVHGTDSVHHHCDDWILPHHFCDYYSSIENIAATLHHSHRTIPDVPLDTLPLRTAWLTQELVPSWRDALSHSL